MRDDDGFFVVPPLEIMRRAHPKIPAEYWPQILTEYGRGVRAPALAAAWNVSEATIWRTLRRARHEEAQA